MITIFHKFPKWLKILLIIIFSLCLIAGLLVANAGKKSKNITYGVTFSYPYAESLALDWKKVYEEMVVDLKVKNLRLPAYWNKVEPGKDEYNFADLDYQIKLASDHNVNIVLSVGKRLPRWPECHEPDWVKGLSKEGKENALLSYIETVIHRYYENPHVTVWQVENEPFLGSFGECEKPDKELLDKEIVLVKKLDPARPILISDSGELSAWIYAGNRGDVFGTTLYRKVFSDVTNHYYTHFIPAWFYRMKAGLVRVFNPGKKIVIIELQAEPWTTKGITQTPIDEQFKTMSPESFDEIVDFAKSTGFSDQYLWGVEWWYWMKTQGHPEFWEKSRNLFNNY